jgi:hypothetical protein
MVYCEAWDEEITTSLRTCKDCPERINGNCKMFRQKKRGGKHHAKNKHDVQFQRRKNKDIGFDSGNFAD